MITLQNLGDSILFTFDENDKYLNNGTISVPMNSLILVTDDSDMATFRKSATNDIFVSALYSDFGMTKAELEEWYAENMVSEVTEEDVDEKIAEAVGEETDRAVSAETALSGAIDAVDAAYKAADSVISGAVDNLSTALQNESQRAVSAETALSGAIESIDSRLTEDEGVIGAGLNALNNSLSEKADISAVTEAIDAVDAAYKAADSVISGAVDNLSSALQNESQRAVSAETALSGAIDTKIDESAITSAITSASTDSEIPTAKAVYDALQESGLDEDTEKLISGSLNDLNERKLDASAYTPTDLTNYYTKSETSGATEISTALASKQTTLTAGTNITIVDNVISATGGGGVTVDPSLDSGSTNPVANSAITEAVIIDASNRDSITANDYGGFRTFYATQVKSISFTKGYTSAYIEGYILLDNSAIKYVFSGNTSSSTTLTDAVTLNLASKTASITVKDRNAHTIRELYMQVWHDNTKQDTSYIYDVNTVFNPPLGVNKAEFVNKCQHYGINVTNELIGGGSSYTAGDGIDITNDVISVTGKVDTSAITTSITYRSTDSQIPSAKAVNDKLGGLSLVKISQAAYDALENKDAITLYIIVDEPTPPSSDGKYKFTLIDDSVVTGECNDSRIDYYDISNYQTTAKEGVIGDCVTEIESYTFDSFSELASITIPSSITIIDDGTFSGCYSLTSIDIPSGVTSIGSNAFSGCSSLTSIEIPSGVTSIGGSAFDSCTGLTSVTVNATTPPTLGEYAFYGTNNFSIYVPSESVNAYKAASGWSDYASRISAIS